VAVEGQVDGDEPVNARLAWMVCDFRCAQNRGFATVIIPYFPYLIGRSYCSVVSRSDNAENNEQTVVWDAGKYMLQLACSF